MRLEVQVRKVYKKDISIVRQERILEALLKLLKTTNQSVSEKAVVKR